MPIKLPNVEWDLDSIDFYSTGWKTNAVIYKQKGSNRFFEDEVRVSFTEWLTGTSLRTKTIEYMDNLRRRLKDENNTIRSLRLIENKVAQAMKNDSASQPKKITSNLSPSKQQKQPKRQKRDDYLDPTSLHSPLNPLNATYTLDDYTPSKSSSYDSCDDSSSKSSPSYSSNYSSSSYSSDSSSSSSSSSDSSSSYSSCD